MLFFSQFEKSAQPSELLLSDTTLKYNTLGVPLWAMIGIAHMGIEMVEGTIAFVAVGVVAAIISLHLLCTTPVPFGICRALHLVRSDCQNVGDLRKQAMRFPLFKFVMQIIHARILTGFFKMQWVQSWSWRAVTRLLCQTLCLLEASAALKVYLPN